MTNYNPSINPADLDTLTGTFRSIMSKALQYTDGVLPAKVISITPGAPMTVQVQPLITLVTTDGTPIARAPIAGVPVFQLGGGNILLSFPVQVGDIGWIVANDRDISTYMQAGAQSPPNTYRVKNFSDSFFMPNILRAYNLAGDDKSATLQTADGTVAIVISATGVIFKGPVTFEGAAVFEAPVVTESTLTVEEGLAIAGGTVTSSSPISVITPTLAVTGDITATGSITPFV